MFMIQLRLHVCWSVPFFRLCSTRLARMDSLQLPAAIAGATTSFPAHTLIAAWLTVPDMACPKLLRS